jgi:Spy/CpxP family protein refolding chaperone
MKKRVLTFLVGLMSVQFLLLAQTNNDEKRKADFERFKARREAFISKAMDLTDDEAKVFWPLCNELQAKKFELNKALRAEIRKIRQAKKEKKNASESDYKKIIELRASIKVKEAQCEEEYIGKFLKIIPAEKIFLYQDAELRFANEMFGNHDRRNPRTKN